MDVAGIATTLGAGAGAAIGWFASSGDQLNQAGTATSIGAAAGGAVGVGIWSACRATAPAGLAGGPGADEDILARFRSLARAEIRGQWRVLLDGRDRLDTTFSGYGTIAPPRGHAPPVRQGSDLVAAVDAAAAAGAPRLLIVGPPGHGKTVALLDAAQHLVDHHHDRFGSPVLLNLGSWSRGDRQLVPWIVRQLCGASGPLPGADRTVTRWLHAGRIAPVLDGLDEIVDPDDRRRCVAAINDFIDRSTRAVAVFVASRPDEYAAVATEGADRLAVDAAIQLHRVSSHLVVARLDAIGTAGTRSLAALLHGDPSHPAVELLRVPLWLWVARTLEPSDVEELGTVTTGAEAQRVLTDAHLARAIAALARDAGLGTEACRRALAALAAFLADPRGPDATTFRLENLTPARPTVAQTRAGALTGGLTFGLSSGLAVGAGPFGLLGGAVLGAAVLGYVGWRAFGRSPDGRPSRSRLRWPPGRPRAEEGRRDTGLATLVVAVCGGLVIGMATGVLGGLVGAAAVGIVYDVFQRLLVSQAVVSDAIDEGRAASWVSVGLHLAVFATVGGSTLWLGIGRPAGLVLGVIGGLILGVAIAADRGGWFLVMQHRVRRAAARQGLLPHPVVPFIQAAVDSRILRRTGGGVQFRHGLLAARLAEDAPRPGLMDLRRRVGFDPAADTP